MTMKIEGLDRLQAALAQLTGEKAVAALRAPMNAAGAKIMTDAKRLTPRDTGALVNSASQRTETSLSEITVTLGYNTPYAIYVHERNLKYKVGQWRYLKTPMDARATSIWGEIADGVEAWLRRTA